MNFSQLPEKIIYSFEPEEIHNLQQKLAAWRFRVAIAYTGVVMIIVAVLATGIYSRRDDNIPLYDANTYGTITVFFTNNPEYKSDDKDLKVCRDNSLDVSERCYNEDNLGDYLDAKSRRWSKDGENALKSMVDNKDMAGPSRSAGLFIFILILMNYRYLQKEFYRAHSQDRQYFYAAQRPRKWSVAGWVKSLDQIGIAVAAMLVSYVLISMMWIILSTLFKEVALPWHQAVLLHTIFMGVIVYVVVSWALVVTIRQLRFFGFLTVLTGLSAGFALAGRYWYTEAISNVGKDPRTDFLFSTTMISLGLILFLVGWDLRHYVEIFWLKLSYLIACIAIICVGIFPTLDLEPGWVKPVTTFLHAGGAIGSGAIFILVWMIWFTLTKKHSDNTPYFSISFRVFSFFFAIVALICFGLYKFADQLSLTVFELIVFAIVGTWLYATVNHILTMESLNFVLEADDEV